MKSSSCRLLVAAVALVQNVAVVDAVALPNPFKKKVAESVPAAPELKAAEAEASRMFAAAAEAEAAGKAGAAEKSYRRIVRDYPFTNAAPAAQFRLAASLEQNGKLPKAFDAYQELIETYRKTPQFAEALDRQYGIAMQSRTERTGSFFGIPRKVDATDLIGMFGKIIANAPQGSHAAEAQFEIGQIFDDDNEPDMAIAAYKKVTEDYPQSPLAKEAQMRVSKNYIGKVKGGSRDESNIKAARVATENSMGLFPDPGADLGGTQTEIDEAASESAFKTGRYYEKRGNLRAAMMYYTEVLKAPGSTHYEEVRDRVNEMSSRDPKLMDSVRDLKVNTTELAVPAASDVKGRAEYFGPPMLASGRVKKSGEVKRPGMRQGDSVPITPIEEPELPTGSDKAGRPDDSLLNPGSVPLPDPGAAVPPPVTPGLEPPSLGPDGGAPPEIPASGSGEKPADEKKGEGEKKAE